MERKKRENLKNPVISNICAKHTCLRKNILFKCFQFWRYVLRNFTNRSQSAIKKVLEAIITFFRIDFTLSF